MSASTTAARRRVRPGRLRRLGRSVVYGVLVAGAVTTLAFLVRVKFDPIIDWDEAAIARATAITRSHSGFRSALLAWQAAFHPTPCYLLARALCLWVWRRHGLATRALWAFVTMMIGWNLALDVKLLVQRARPVVGEPIEMAPGFSFPSGHVSNVAIATTAVIVLLWPLLSRTSRRMAVALGALLIGLTCLDRVFLGVHYPSDCMGGILLGCGLVLSSYAGYAGWNPAKELP